MTTMSDLDDIRMLADRVDDHNWWLGELEQYNMPQAYVEYFMAVKPSTVMDTFGDADDMQCEIDELDRQVYDLECENSDLDRAVDDLTGEAEDMREEIDSLTCDNEDLESRLLKANLYAGELRSEIEALNKYIDTHVDDDLED